VERGTGEEMDLYDVMRTGREMGRIPKLLARRGNKAPGNVR
jgi:hypothetical protein